MIKTKPFKDPDGCNNNRLWLTSEVAEILRLSAETIRRGIRDGRIKAQKFGRTWRISDSELERLVQQGLQ